MTGLEKELVDFLKEKMVIPFIGAGYSVTCGFPSWKQLIEYLFNKLGVDPNDIKHKSDFLRIAEYLKILNDGKIGPIRYEIQKLFNEQSVDISAAEPFLHLVSLAAPIIYTTNYDNLIENTFEYLKIPYIQVVTAQDILKASNNNFPQIVKFHGSFEHEETLVLTESDYFNRLEFESPIDIKLRADILGKSIIFIGYSFSDFNIRYLWFKLKKMMKGVSEKEIPKSFILLTEPDRMMETLLQNIGIFPIYLKKYKGGTLTENLCDFLECLIIGVNESPDWPFDMPIIATNAQIDKMVCAIHSGDEKTALKYLWLLNNSRFGENQVKYLTTGERKITDQEMGFWFSLVEQTTPKARRILINLLFKLKQEYDLSCYSLMIISFLRYREARDVEMGGGWPNINNLKSCEKLSREAEFQMLFDALVWTKFNEDVKKDTTLYFFDFISSYFRDRMDEKITNPTHDCHLNHLPVEYYEITPQKVVDYIKEAAAWIPDIEAFEAHEFDRICGACGCMLQMEGEFDWNFSNDDEDTVKRIFSK